MKTRIPLFVVAASTLFTASASAHDDNYDPCDVELQGNIRYASGMLNIDMDNGSQLTITPDYMLAVNGEWVKLSAQEQQWVETYHQQLETAIPMTLNIASQGLDIASVAVNEAFGELLGPDDELIADFNALFASLEADMQAAFYDAKGNIQIDSTRFDEPGWFDNAWEARFEEQFESLVSESVGRILIAVGTEMMLEGDMAAFESKMERFGRDIEQRVEMQAEALTRDADALCEVLARADDAESQMQQHIRGLDGLNLLDMPNRKLKM